MTVGRGVRAGARAEGGGEGRELHAVAGPHGDFEELGGAFVLDGADGETGDDTERPPRWVQRLRGQAVGGLGALEPGCAGVGEVLGEFGPTAGQGPGGDGRGLRLTGT